EINEIARSDGDIVPQGYVQIVQHLEGGLVKEIMVKEGAFVRKGEQLLKLDGAGSQEELNEQKSKLLTLRLQRERLLAVTEGREPDFAALKAPEPLRKEQLRIYESMMTTWRGEQAVLKEQIAQKERAILVLQMNQQITRDSLG